MKNDLHHLYLHHLYLHHLHDKATRGEMLTTEEEAALAAWYARQDQEEKALLNSSSHSPAPDALQNEVKMTLMRLEVMAQQVRAQAEENEVLRREIVISSQRMAQTQTLQST